MKDLKKDFESRLDSDNQILFETFAGKKYNTKEIKFYFFYILKKLKTKSKNIILICNPSLESHILSTFFIFSEFDIYLVNNYSHKDLYSIPKTTTIVFDESTYQNLKKIIFSDQIILAPSIDDFLKWTHPSFDLDLITDKYKKNNIVGRSIFMSSGSTGQPKIIPLKYDQINECYKNVLSGFLNKLNYEKIISVHDTSFVIILPFIFCLACSTKASLVACDLNSISNPILKLVSNIDKLTNQIIISVPSVYRIIFNLLKNKFEEFIANSIIISCGEPLDKKLSKIINKSNPKKFFNLYGSTEVAPWIIFLDVKNYLDQFHNNYEPPSVLPAGIALPNVELRLDNNEELLVYSKSVFNGYESQSNSNNFEKIDNKIFFKTGDLFKKEGKNYFCRGRINSSVKIAGIFVNPILLELEIKNNLSIENLVIIPDIINSKLIIIIFEKDNDFLRNLLPLIKKIINKKSASNISTQFIIDNKSIEYLKSGKINRNFYNNKVLN